MKKLIQKPSNWQDFESLCKMLLGEIWGISDKIKQNGRLGQSQFGVDVYGIPKGKEQYSGIQCKGKNDNLKSILTEKEIDEEIENAKKFVPKLETFIFATTASKDVKIEEYVRLKDVESRKNGGFEILLYCWEDISDLIEINRNTFNYFVLQNQFKSNHELDLTFSNGEKTIKVVPKFRKRIINYVLKDSNEARQGPMNLSRSFSQITSLSGIYNSNKSWIKVELRFKNTGSVVIEDYKLIIIPEIEKIEEMRQELSSSGLPILRVVSQPFWVFEGEKYAIYKRNDNEPLIQKVEKSFSFYLLTTNKEVHKIKVRCEFFARDFNFEEI